VGHVPDSTAAGCHDVAATRRARSGMLLVVCLMIVTVNGCDGNASTPVVRVDGASITAAAVDHRMHLLQEGHTSSTARLRRQAIDYLISARWLAGELVREGIELTDAEVDLRLQKARESRFPGGPTELAAFLRATGQNSADLRQQAEVELASEKLRERVVRAVARPSAAEVATYYARHRHRFLIPERRVVEIDNRKHKPEMLRVRREVEQRHDLAAEAEKWTLVRPSRTPQPLEAAIYAARPNSLVGPVRQGVDYFLFEVTRIVPAHYRPLSQVAPMIVRQLSAARARQALRAFIRSWRRRWRAKTDCRGGYVVDDCAEYRGRAAPETGVTFMSDG
jgi:foldase protein PrsA